MNSTILCFYHANCVDGASAAAILKRKYPEAKMLPMNHGEAIPEDYSGKTVFIVDFSFPASLMKDLKTKAKEVFWYDHHKTAVPIQQELGWGTVDLEESGASLTFKQEHPSQALPKIIQYVRDKDLWLWQLPQSREVSVALREHEDIHDPAGKSWKYLIQEMDEEGFKKLVQHGALSLKGLRVRILDAAKKGFEINFHGHKALAVNWGLESSELGEYIYKELNYPLGLIFHYTGDTWSFSLRSNKIDVSELAQKHGGGGHPGAAGFRSQEIAWLLELKV
ncbi:MAG: hypothetical protein HQM15_06230 [Deltaproteobacteria bacterium]|nr:hypothetical protein [Deltaproteobacteria bacterium]